MIRFIARAGFGLVAAGCCGLSAGAASPLIEKADTNNDGRIELAEFSALGDQKFLSMDSDGNGLVTDEERRAYHTAKRAERDQKRFMAMDTNGDGVISNAEYTAAQERREDRVKAMLDTRKQKRKARQKLSKPDSNEDGVIDLAEHRDATIQVFELMDRDSDGYLTGNEARMPKRRGLKKHRGLGR